MKGWLGGVGFENKLLGFGQEFKPSVLVALEEIVLLQDVFKLIPARDHALMP
jgi:hypothetical protein